jgi:putative phage-type endonuclease
MIVERIPREDDGRGLDPTIDRTKQIHASDVSSILGLNPYSSPLQVWLEKTGRSAPRLESKYARLGKHLEGAVADMYAEETGLTLLDPRVTLLRRSVPIAATPDRYAYAGDCADVDRIVEIKTAWTRKTASAWGEPGTDQVPEHYRCQGIVYLALSGVQRLDFAFFDKGYI